MVMLSVLPSAMARAIRASTAPPCSSDRTMEAMDLSSMKPCKPSEQSSRRSPSSTAKDPVNGTMGCLQANRLGQGVAQVYPGLLRYPGAGALLLRQQRVVFRKLREPTAPEQVGAAVPHVPQVHPAARKQGDRRGRGHPGPLRVTVHRRPGEAGLIDGLADVLKRPHQRRLKGLPRHSVSARTLCAVLPEQHVDGHGAGVLSALVAPQPVAYNVYGVNPASDVGRFQDAHAVLVVLPDGARLAPHLNPGLKVHSQSPALGDRFAGRILTASRPEAQEWLETALRAYGLIGNSVVE